MKVQPLPLQSMHISKSKIAADLTSVPIQKQTVEAFDPRHSEDRTTSEEYMLSQLRKLQDVFPKSELPTMISKDLSRQIEVLKIGQRDNDKWRELHKGRLTSSMFRDILSSNTTALPSLLKRIIHGSDLDKYSRLPDAVQWGIDNEAMAREEYLEFKALFGTVKYEDAGLRLFPECVNIGASSDGKVTDYSMSEEQRNGVLEIKCHVSVDKIQVKNLEISDITDMHNSFLENYDTGPSLKRNHKYYAQVQGEMYLYGVTWFDFVVWTNAPVNNIIIERIDFDENYVDSMLHKLKKFYCTNVKPALINS